MMRYNAWHCLLLMSLLLLCTFHSLQAQKRQYKYWIEFSDKNNTPYCTCRPFEFLSARAMERRAKAGIAVVENDLPVNPHYLRALNVPGVSLHHTSRWLNAATVIADSDAVAPLRRLPFVKKVQYLGPHLRYRNPPNKPVQARKLLTELPKIPHQDAVPTEGYTWAQNSLMGTDFLHAAGYRGQGIQVAVMDGGFTNVDVLNFFDSLDLQGRLIPGYDFVEHDFGLYEAASHGSSVLSVMAANLPGYFMGTAPDATYILLKTEDTGGEFPVEETNWIAGAEWADSAGVDIINASLGYTKFNDTTLGHWYRELDGRSTIGSRGAAIAATKGMIVCNSMGNEGDHPWKYMGSPADAPGLISVGAVSLNRQRAAFSSWGPTADGRIKPDLMAPGDEVVVCGYSGVNLAQSSGTSLASPMLAGSLASLWSAFPEKTAEEILEAVLVNADQYNKPDNERGYGLPDLSSTFFDLQGYVIKTMLEPRNGLSTYHRNKGELFFLPILPPFERTEQIIVRDMQGRRIPISGFEWLGKEIKQLKIKGLHNLHPGVYWVTFVHDQDAVPMAAFVW
jgi:serine protease AprX